VPVIDKAKAMGHGQIKGAATTKHGARDPKRLQQRIRRDERQITPAAQAEERSRDARWIAEAMQDAKAMRERQEREDGEQRGDFEPRVPASGLGVLHPVES